MGLSYWGTSEGEMGVELEVGLEVVVEGFEGRREEEGG